jgi:hypothetical protein
MTLGPKAQTANNPQQFFLEKRHLLGVSVVRFLPMASTRHILKYYYKNDDSSFLK